MATEVFTGYVSRAEAIRTLGSKATIERLVRQRRLGSKLVPRDGRKPERVYLAEDVEKLKRGKEERREARPPSQIAPRAHSVDALALLRDVLIGRQLPAPEAMKRPEPEAPKPLTPWITLKEAAAVSGLTRKDLRQLGQQGKIVMRPVGNRILRKSLEAFEG